MKNSACGKSMRPIKGVARGESRRQLKSEAEESKETGTKSVSGARWRQEPVGEAQRLGCDGARWPVGAMD